MSRQQGERPENPKRTLKPLVVTNACRAPLRSRRAFVATVVDRLRGMARSQSASPKSSASFREKEGSHRM